MGNVKASGGAGAFGGGNGGGTRGSQFNWVWDTDELWVMHSNLKKQKKKLEEEKQKILKSQEKLFNTWYGDAAAQYKQALVVDMNQLDEIIKGLDKQINSLELVIKDYLEPCNKKIKQIVIACNNSLKW